MRKFLFYFSIVFFSIFIGSQITEGVLLVPYWQSLSSVEFYSYYKEFGSSIDSFYRVLTIIAVLIPIAITIYCWLTTSNALRFALCSSIFAILFISLFFIYFKDTNELFYQAAFSDTDLQKEFISFSYWHWSRVVLEIVSLIFLILALIKIQES